MKKSLALILFLTISSLCWSQSSEMGIMIGVSSYKGDLKSNQFTLKDNHLAGGILYRHSMNNHWSFKTAIDFGRISAADSNSNDAYQQYRNLSFRSRFQELTMQFEFNFFKFQTANPATKFSPYLLAGITVFHFNPEANLNGTWYKLQPLGTEGQGTSTYSKRKKYKRTSAAFTFGGGMKFSISRRFGLGIEAGVRKTYTDYLDDVSSTYADRDVIKAANGIDAALLSDRSGGGDHTNRDRGNRNDKDWYMFTGVQINYTLSKKYNDSCKPFRTKFR